MIAVVGRPRAVREEEALESEHTMFGRGACHSCFPPERAQWVHPLSILSCSPSRGKKVSKGGMGWGRRRNEPSVVGVSHGGVDAHVCRDTRENYVGDAPGGRKLPPRKEMSRLDYRLLARKRTETSSCNLPEGVGGRYLRWRSISRSVA